MSTNTVPLNKTGHVLIPLKLTGRFKIIDTIDYQLDKEDKALFDLPFIEPIIMITDKYWNKLRKEYPTADYAKIVYFSKSLISFDILRRVK